jgi:cyclopropane fatty-acyl-phospholipid synthase-like methyltransferase
MDACYGSDLAWVHHTGYSQHVENIWPGIVRLLRDAGLGRGARVLDVGCGSGLLARRLVDADFDVTGVDASPAMIELARTCVPDAHFRVVRLPGSADALPRADAIVSTGHVLNYLDTRDDIAHALGNLASALERDGILAIDLMTEAFAQRPEAQTVHAKVAEDWAIVTRFSRPVPGRFDREITVFRRVGEHWRRSDEHHRNLAFDAQEALAILRHHGIAAEQRRAFGSETLPEGLIVLTGTRRS